MRKIFMFLMVAMCATMFSSCSDDDDDDDGNGVAPIDVIKGVITFTTNVKVFEKNDVNSLPHHYCHIYTAKNGKISVDWGDGKITEYIGIVKTPEGGKDYDCYDICLDHIYDQEKTHTVKITGAILGINGYGVNGVIGNGHEVIHDSPFTSLDVSKCPVLKKLYCMGCNLTSLDVSKNTALEGLKCAENNLTSLDVSKNTALKELQCHFHNNLTSLDISKNTALEYLCCGDNNLTSLDVSKNTALRTLMCYGNNLTSLDVSKNTALNYLNCKDNNLTSLDVKNTALSHLDCGKNKFNDSAWNKIYTDLPQNQIGRIYIEKNLSIGDPSIAEKKGWTVIYY